MNRHIYYRVIIQLLSPLAIGSGTNDNTDNDVVLDSRGFPYIPATSIAGVMRSCYDDPDNNLEAIELFGSIKNETKSSSVKVYDAIMPSDTDFFVTNRDCVALERKVGKKGAKFDFEAVESGAEFVTYLELDKYSDGLESEIESILSEFHSGAKRFGGKTSRGYGLISLKSVQKKSFVLPDEKKSWLDFDMFSDDCWKGSESLNIKAASSAMTKISLQLKQVGAISIRQYSTDISKTDNDKVDYKQLCLKDGTPVIPGTSWSGAFRERFTAFSDKATADKLFGMVENDVVMKSKILFSETKLSGCTNKVITRNSIDRFSAKTKHGALYTESTFFGGTTMLDIMIPNDTDEKNRKLLSAVIADLDRGYLAVGGLTSIGHGLFEVADINVNGESRIEKLKALKLCELI